MGLMMAWLNEAETMPLTDGEPDFFELGHRWMAGVLH